MRQWILISKPTGLPALSGDNQTFKLPTVDLPLPLKENQVLVKLLLPLQRPCSTGRDLSPTSTQTDYTSHPSSSTHPMHARGLAGVLDPKSENVKKGDIVTAQTGWSKYAVVDARAVQSAPELPGELSRTHYLGALGMMGLTAYYRIEEVRGTEKGYVVVVSGAAGATGSMAIQIAIQIVGAKRVVGIAGGEEECRFVIEGLGTDACVDYKREELRKAASAEVGGNEKGHVDVYFDNVGGEMVDFMLSRMAMHGRVVACAAVSEYNSSQGTLLRNYFEIISMRIQIRGTIVLEYSSMAQEVTGSSSGRFRKAS